MVMLTNSTKGDSPISPKFSLDMSMMAAAAMSPTMTSRKVAKISLIAFDLLCFRRNLLMLTIKRKGSQITLNEANTAPSTAAHVGNPA